MQTASEIRRTVRVALATSGLTLAEVCRRNGFLYERVGRVLRGYRPARDGEIEAILAAVRRATGEDDAEPERRAV